MRKFVKMSLAAAVTLAGLNSSVSANTLTEVADNFDVFGYVQVRYDNSNSQDKTSNDSFTHKEVLGATGKLTDNLSYMFAGANLEIDDKNAEKGIGYSSLLMVYNYFTYTGIENTSISAGRQGLDTPLTVVYDPATATSEANGVSLTSKLADVSINAAYFVNTNFDLGDRNDTTTDTTKFPGTAITGAESYGHIGLTAKAGPATVDAWYATMSDKYDTYTVGAKANIKAGDAMIKPYLRYSAADIDGVNEDNSLWKVGVSAKAGIVGANIDYGQTDKDGGWVTFDNDASANLQGWKLSLLGNADAKLMKAGLNVDVLPNVNLSANYVDLEIANSDANEVYATATYKITKSITAYARFGQVDDDAKTDKEEFSRVNLLWLF